MKFHHDKLSQVLINTLILFSVLAFSPVLFSQAPFSTVKNDVLKEYQGVTVIERDKGVIEIDKSYIPNRKYYYAYVTASNGLKIEGHNVTHHRDLVVTYDITSGKNVFSEITKSQEWLVGDLKPPALNEVQELVNKNILKFFTSYLANYITEFNGIKAIITDKYPCYQCDHFYFPVGDEGKSVHFKVLADYSCINGTDLEKRQDVFEVKFVRDGINQPWKGFPEGTANRSNTQTKTYEKKTLSSQEQDYWTCNTLGVKAWKENAVTYFNSLPKVEIPKFAKAQDMAWWLHKFLRKAKAEEVEYVFISLLQPAYFLNCGSYMLNENGLKLIETVKKMVSLPRGNYGDHYCETPDIKHQQGNDADYMVQFFPKYGQTFSRIRTGSFNGALKISDIQLSIYTKKEDVDAVMNASSDKCKENMVALWKNYTLKEYKTSASFPSEPAKQTFPDRPDKLALALQFDKIEWAITAEKISSEQMAKFKDNTKMQAYAKQLSEYTRNKYEATPGSDKIWQIRGSRGYESNWTVKKDGIYLDMKYRAVIFKGVFYEIWVMGKFEQKDLNKFLESVSIDT